MSYVRVITQYLSSVTDISLSKMSPRSIHSVDFSSSATCTYQNRIGYAEVKVLPNFNGLQQKYNRRFSIFSLTLHV